MGELVTQSLSDKLISASSEHWRAVVETVTKTMTETDTETLGPI